MSQRGQTLIESAMALWLIIFTFVCVYFTFLLAVDKLRALESAYYAARIYQVHGYMNSKQKTKVQYLKFGRPASMILRSVGGANDGPGVQEVEFQYLPRTFAGLMRTWHTFMWTPEPARNFILSSWPGAPTEQFPSENTLIAEAWKAEKNAELPSKLKDLVDTVDLISGNNR